MDVVAQPSVHPEVRVSPLGSGEAQHPMPISVNFRPPKKVEPSATEEVSAHPPTVH